MTEWRQIHRNMVLSGDNYARQALAYYADGDTVSGNNMLSLAHYYWDHAVEIRKKTLTANK